MLNVTPVQLCCSQTPAPVSMVWMAAPSQLWGVAAAPACQAEQTQEALAGRGQRCVGGPQSLKGPSNSWVSPQQTPLRLPQPPG